MSHHPSEETLIGYVAGSLPAPHRVVVRTHLAMCASCQVSLRLAHDLAGVMLEACAPAQMQAGAMGAGALERALAGLDLRDSAPTVRAVPTTPAGFATGRWRWVAPGLRMMAVLPRDRDDARLDLIRVSPGAALSLHGHRGLELTLVLQGAFADETGEFGVGALAEGDEALDHRPRALRTGQDCVCLVATIGRLRLHEWLPRLVQPLVGV